MFFCPELSVRKQISVFPKIFTSYIRITFAEYKPRVCFSSGKSLHTPEVVAHWSSGLVGLRWVSIQTVELVLWFAVFYGPVQVTCPVHHDTDGPSLPGRKHITHNTSLHYNTCAAVTRCWVKISWLTKRAIVSKLKPDSLTMSPSLNMGHSGASFGSWRHLLM